MHVFDKDLCCLRLYVRVQVTIVPGLGITLESCRRCGLQSQRRFLEQSTLRGVFINEVSHTPRAAHPEPSIEEQELHPWLQTR